MSYAPEVIADSSGKFCGNALRFATREEAQANVDNLADRWVLVRETRVVESSDPVNYSYLLGEDGRRHLIAVAVAAQCLTCGKLLDVPGDAASVNCGGDCAACVETAEAGVS